MINGLWRILCFMCFAARKRVLKSFWELEDYREDRGVLHHGVVVPVRFCRASGISNRAVGECQFVPCKGAPYNPISDLYPQNPSLEPKS